MVSYQSIKLTNCPSTYRRNATNLNCTCQQSNTSHYHSAWAHGGKVYKCTGEGNAGISTNK